jgi:hypothetical protein
MLIDCTHCQARVNAEVLKAASYGVGDDLFEMFNESYRLSLLRCPECQHLLVGKQFMVKPGDEFTDPEWDKASRVWPDPISDLAVCIPEKIRVCLLEARKCLHATAYTACVAMSGRAIEAMCKHFSTKKESLFEGLKELYDRKIIDERLYQWGDELRKHRNLAAHASDAKFTQMDAKDLYDFSTAICDYVFVLTEKFEGFRKRQAKKEASQGEEA